jgi:membrane protease YdiL (CAAX protease family)
MLVLVLGSTLIWTSILVRWVTRLLTREEILLGFDPEPFFARTPGGRQRALFLGMALTVLGYFYFGQWLQARDVRVGLALSLWILLPAMALGVVRMVRPVQLDWRRDFGIRPAPINAALGAILLGLGLMLPIVGGLQPLVEKLLPMPAADAARMGSALSDFTVLQAFLLAALSPALMEEFVFRGVLFGLLRRENTTRFAVVVSAACFALVHLSIHRFPPTFLLGLVLAILVARHGSLLPAMLMHLVYNGVLLVGGNYYTEHWAETGPPMDLDGPLAWAISVGLLWVGAWLAGLTPSLRPPAEPLS